MNYEKKANECRRKVLEMVHRAGTSHIASNFSCIDFATVLYGNLKSGDEVVWSKGWAAATIYYFLAQTGKIPVEDLDKFAKEIDGKIPYLGLVETTTSGVWANAGSVGHGLPIAVGMALAKKRKKEEGTIYCIMSDGGLNEGTTWESAMLAKQHKLDNLVVLVDANKFQAMGKTEDIINVDPVKAFEGFGWVARNTDGHNYEEIDRTFGYIEQGTFAMKGTPRAIIYNTTKGKGVSFMEDSLEYHYKHITEEVYNKAMEELNA